MQGVRMMPTIRELIDAAMAGYEITPADLDELISKPEPEGLFLDYKHGNELKDARKARSTIRQYVSGFANSSGGMLIIGVDEESWSVTGCTAPGGHDLAAWAADCISGMAQYFSPLPRFQTVKHPQGNVLVAIAERSQGLVPCLETGDIVYYLRFHDQTLKNKTVKAPDYLVNDLLLGRRQQPYLEITDSTISGIQVDYSHVHLDIHADLIFSVSNMNLSWAEGVRIGCISWGKQQFANPPLISNHLRSYFDMQAVDIQPERIPWELIHIRTGIVGLEALEAIALSGIPLPALPMRVHKTWSRYNWKAAIYLLSKSAAPVWYQLTITVIDELLKFAHDPGDLSLGVKFLQLERVSGRRPVVACESL